MTVEEILNALSHKDNKFPREALEQATAQKEEITPHLLKILERVADDLAGPLVKRTRLIFTRSICWRSSARRGLIR